MASKSVVLFRALGSMIIAIALVGCGSGATPSAAPTATSSVPTTAPSTATAGPSISPGSSRAPVKTPAAGASGGGNLGVYATEIGSTIELLEDGTCNFQTTKGTLDGCLYVIRGSNIQFSAGDGSQFAYIFANGCIYAGKIGTEDHATFCK